LAVTIGLAPLVRPDLAVVGVGFLGLLLGLCRPVGWRGPAGLAAAAVALPAAYQLFRMGYFAALVSNSAIAKEAFSAHWEQGWHYARDFGGVYWLGLPAVPLIAWGGVRLTAAWRAGRWRTVALIGVPVACGLLHGGYVVRVGGDFMHARLLLPSLFAMLLPVMAVAGERWWHPALPMLGVMPWAIGCALWLRVPYSGAIGPHEIADERGFYAQGVGRALIPEWTEDGLALRRLAEQRRRVLLLGNESAVLPAAPPAVPLAPWVMASVAAGRYNIGWRGYTAGPRVHLVDRHGITDPLAARLRLERRGRPGHEKSLSDEWIVARFADPAAPLPRSGPSAPAVVAGRAALACGDLRELREAVEAPLTGDRFRRNITVAWRLHRLTVPGDPRQASRELCARP